MAACGGADGATSSTTATPPTSTATPTISATTEPPPTTAPPLSATTAPSGPSFVFTQVGEDTAAYSYTISYPSLLDTAGEPVISANDAVDRWVEETVAELESAAATLDGKASLTAQVAPELLNESILSLSGVSTRFVDVSAGTVSRRHGWIIDLRTGAAVTAQELLIDGDLAPLAEAARRHLIADVLGNEDALTGPDGLLPVPANFQAVWLTTDGIGIGFYEGQVAAPEAGSPAVLIPFTELDPFLNKSGVLEALASGDHLPEV